MNRNSLVERFYIEYLEALSNKEREKAIKHLNTSFCMDCGSILRIQENYKCKCKNDN